MLVNLLPLLEAKDSSEIENIVTTTDELFKYAAEDKGADHATKEALRYRTALYQGFVQLEQRPLCTATALEVCSTLKNVQMDIRKVPGTIIGNQTTGEIIYTPPCRGGGDSRPPHKLGALPARGRRARSANQNGSEPLSV